MEKIFALLVLVSLASSSPTPPSPTATTSQPFWEDEPPTSTCDNVMSEGGLTPRFASSVAHRVHSLTVEDIQYYFSAAATEANNIPTVNQDLSSTTRVLSFAPLSGYDTSFLTSGLR